MQPSPIFLQPDPAQVYQPAEDSWFLLKISTNEIQAQDRVLEVGVGSGYILSHLPSCLMKVGTDINPHAVQMASQRGIPVIRTDLVQGIKGEFDLILFNSPYLPTKPNERIDDWLEYALDGGPDGRSVINRFLTDIRQVLAPGARVLLLISSLTGREEIITLTSQKGFWCSDILTEPVEGGERLIILKLVRKVENSEAD
ncbi:MAG TPA: HemK2/MTQ2 family protein methyltransferase [Methanospirillum sp.]|nr:HemK2/MTQ2 family protein methyltransferase [Methanospirillum sp.]